MSASQPAPAPGTGPVLTGVDGTAPVGVAIPTAGGHDASAPQAHQAAPVAAHAAAMPNQGPAAPPPPGAGAYAPGSHPSQAGAAGQSVVGGAPPVGGMGLAGAPADLSLLEGERALEMVRPSWRAFVGSWVTAALLALAALVVIGLALALGGDAVFLAVFGLLMLLLAAVAVIVPIIQLVASRYILTDRRIIQRFDLWVHNESTVWYERVQNVKVRQGIVERLFDAGSVYVETAAGGSAPEENLRWVHQPRELRSRLMQLIEGRRGGDPTLGDPAGGGNGGSGDGGAELELLGQMVGELRALRAELEADRNGASAAAQPPPGAAAPTLTAPTRAGPALAAPTLAGPTGTAQPAAAVPNPPQPPGLEAQAEPAPAPRQAQAPTPAAAPAAQAAPAPPAAPAAQPSAPVQAAAQAAPAPAAAPPAPPVPPPPPQDPTATWPPGGSSA